MSNTPDMMFDVDKQLKDIESFTKQQKKEISELINSSQKEFSKDATESVNAIQQQVAAMMSNTETKLEKEISKINEQLQKLLPNQAQ